MRISINLFTPVDAKAEGTLQTWVESHKDGQNDYFVVVSGKQGAIVFEFEYGWMLGCHRLFLLDPTNDELLMFFAEDFTDIGKWIFNRCSEYFGNEYDILM